MFKRRLLCDNRRLCNLTENGYENRIIFGRFVESDFFVSFCLTQAYARDIGRKIKSSLNTKGREGKPLTNHPPYGYDKDPER